MSTITEPHEPLAFFQRFGTASAKIHEFLDPDGEVVQALQEFPAQKNVNKTNKLCLLEMSSKE